MKTPRLFKRHSHIVALVFVSMLIAADLGAGEIHEAAAAGDLAKVKVLLEGDATLLESKDDRLEYKGNTPLISACWGPPSNAPRVVVANLLIDKDFDLAQRLIAMGADVNIRAYGDFTPLHRTVLSGNFRVAKLLIDHGADLNASGAEGTVLHFAINFSQPNEQMTQLLVESGAKLNQRFNFGNTELHLAVLLRIRCLEIHPCPRTRDRLRLP